MKKFNRYLKKEYKNQVEWRLNRYEILALISKAKNKSKNPYLKKLCLQYESMEATLMFIDDCLRREYKYGVSKDKIIEDIREKICQNFNYCSYATNKRKLSQLKYDKKNKGV